jgi:hypothetical protein
MVDKAPSNPGLLLVPNPLNEVIEIVSPVKPNYKEMELDHVANELKGLTARNLVGRRVSVRWAAGTGFVSGTVVGYTKSLKKCLIYFDVRTIPKDEKEVINPNEDFYAVNLLKMKLENWKFLGQARGQSKNVG